MNTNHPSHKDQLIRLKRIQGQVGGIIKMLDEQRYCVDILTQLRAARAALRRVEQNVLDSHVRHCVAGAAQSGSQRQAEAKVDELLQVVKQFTG